MMPRGTTTPTTTMAMTMVKTRAVDDLCLCLLVHVVNPSCGGSEGTAPLAREIRADLLIDPARGLKKDQPPKGYDDVMCLMCLKTGELPSSNKLEA